jgi:hypothetical protein
MTSDQKSTKDLSWTSELPTKPGLYWFKQIYKNGQESISVCEIEEAGLVGEFFVIYIGNEEEFSLPFVKEGVLWYGPISPPEQLKE